MDEATNRPHTEPSFDLGTPAERNGYRVLARKYRPTNFDDLIGQDSMVRTISNAFETGRIPHAWMLTGVRGVGKTTTARILARALNYETDDGSISGPTVLLPKMGRHCQAIMESRHIDVVEMDAASHRGIDDVRQISDASHYAPVSARFKVYILDEVHMLTDPAFNALLKTLEEPPPHLKFIFATTEVRRVPITVLSRCQRFDLRRINTAMLVTHLESISAKEGIDANREALALIARAADGSVRDALSLFDQAIAHAAGSIGVEEVRHMLGLSDRTGLIELFESLMRGDISRALDGLRIQYDSGADPSVVLGDLADFTHFVTRVKIAPAIANDTSISELERTRSKALATALSMRILSRTWQMLLRGISEVQTAAKPIACAEMVLVRIAYASDLPTPDEAIRTLLGSESGELPSGSNRTTPGSSRDTPNSQVAPTSTSGPPAAISRTTPRRQLNGQATTAVEVEPAGTVTNFDDLIALAQARRDLQIKMSLERDVRLVRCEEGRLEIALEPSAPKAFVNDLSRKLTQWTGRQWIVIVSSEPSAPTLRSQIEFRRATLEQGVRADPLVQTVLAKFPGAEIVSVRGHHDGLGPLPDPGDDPLDDNYYLGEDWTRDD